MENTKGYITIKKHMDCMHRVVDHTSKCRHCHGHSYLYDLTFEYDTITDIGYSIDFAELKRVGVQWLEDNMDHGALLNPTDSVLINACKELNSKVWLMSLNGAGNYCNPSVENIAVEVFLAMEVLFRNTPNLRPHAIKIYETPNCYTDCFHSSIREEWRNNFLAQNEQTILEYAAAKGTLQYDSRLC